MIKLKYIKFVIKELDW